MSDAALDRLCDRFGLDREAARRATTAPAGAAPPWYIRAAIGVGAWVTAVAMILSVGGILVEVLPDESLPLNALGFGLAIGAAAIALRRAAGGDFRRQCAVAAALAGHALVAAGVGAETESLAIAAVAATATAAMLTIAIRGPELQFLTFVLTVGLALAGMLEADLPQAAGIMLVATLPPAILLLTVPPAAIDLRGLAWALLLVPLGTLAIPELGGLGDGWLPRAPYAAALAVVIALLWRQAPPARRAAVIAAGAVAVLVSAVAVAGITGSLLLLALAYLLGSRMLAAVGTVAHVGFLGLFYYDLALTLLEKSGALAVAGALLLALWWAWSRAGAREAGHG